MTPPRHAHSVRRKLPGTCKRVPVGGEGSKMADQMDPDQLKKLEDRIQAAKAAQKPKPRERSKYEASSLAWRMVIELVVGMVLGCLIGFGLDSLFGTLPIFLMIFALLGFAAGVRTMMRSAEEVQRKRRKADEDGE